MLHAKEIGSSSGDLRPIKEAKPKPKHDPKHGPKHDSKHEAKAKHGHAEHA
jgi:hypothetical protein